MAENQVYLIKSGQNSFVEETQAIVGISGGKVGIGTTVPESFFHVAGDTQIDGDLTVKGNFTTVESTTIQVDDKNIELGVGSTSDAAADGGGITLHGATNKTFNWVDATDAWTSSEHLHLTAGKRFAADAIRALGAGGLSVGDDAGNGIFVQDGGKVGIATANPGYDLDVNGSGNFDSLYIQGNSVLTGDGSIFGKWEDAATAGEIYYNGGNVGVGVVDPSAQLHVVGNTLLNGDVSASTIKAIDVNGLTLGDDAGNGIFVEDGGHVGINTTSPNYNLHVNGAAHVGGDFSVGSEFKISAGGAIGGTAPASDGDIIKWDDANSKWVAGANLGGGGGGGVGEVPAATINSLPSGQSIYEIEFAETYNVEPRIATQLEIDGEGSIIPYVVSGVSTSGYHLIFAQDIPNNNYRIHTTFGGRDVHWETGSSASLYYNDGDVSIQRNFTIGGNLTVNGTTTTVNTETVEIEDHNLVIAANTGYNQLDSQYPAGGAYAGVLWGTGDAGSASPVSLTYQTNKGFAFEGGNVGIGTTNPQDNLHLASSLPTIRLEDTDVADGKSYCKINSSSNAGLKIDLDPDSNRSDTDLRINIDGSEKIRIDSDGNVGIGAANPESNLHIQNSIAPAITIGKTGSQAADVDLGVIQFKNNDGSHDGPNIVSSITCKSVNSVGSGGYLTFSTHPGGDGNNEGSLPTARMIIDGSGNVGIGTTNPGAKLDLGPISALVGPTLRLSGGTGGASGIDPYPFGNIEFFSNDSSGIGKKVAAKISSIADTSSAAPGGELAFYTIPVNPTSVNDLTERMRIDSSGNVGIGTAVPAAGLHVFSSGNGELEVERSSGAKINLQAQSAFAAIGSESNHDFGIKANNAVVMRLTTSGRVGVGTTAPGSKFHIRGDGSAETKLTIDSGTTSHAASISFSADNERAKILGGYDSGGGGFIKFNTDTVGGTATDRMIINNEGNVGINTTNPREKLQVNGSIVIGGGHFSSSPQNALVLAPYGEGTDVSGGDLSVYAGRSTGTGSGGDINFLTSPAGQTSGETNNSFVNRLTITSEGNVGIGTTNPDTGISTDVTMLQIEDNNLPLLKLRHQTGGSLEIYKTGAGDTRFAHNEATQLTISSGGNVGIGTTNPVTQLEVASASNTVATSRFYNGGGSAPATVHIIEDGNSVNHVGLFVGPNDLSSAVLITKHNNVGIGTTDPNKKLHIVGDMRIGGGGNYENIIIQNETKFGVYEGVVAILPGTIPGSGASEMATYFKNNSLVGTSKHDVLIDGKVGIGTTAPGYKLEVVESGAAYAAQVKNTATNPFGLLVRYTDGVDQASSNPFIVCTDEVTARMRVYSDGDVWTSDSGTLTSDEQLKTNIVDATPKLEDIKKLKVRNFEWIPEFHPAKVGEKKIGFIAQELEQVFPGLVDEHDINLGEEEISRKSVRLGALIPILVKGMQEQQSIIEDLKSQNASLESRISALES